MYVHPSFVPVTSVANIFGLIVLSRENSEEFRTQGFDPFESSMMGQTSIGDKLWLAKRVWRERIA